MIQMALPSNSSTNSSLILQLENCYASDILLMILSLLAFNVLLTPLFFYILIVGYKRWRREGLSAPFTKWSHTDVFTYNVVVLDLLNLLSTLFCIVGFLTEKLVVEEAGIALYCISIPGQTLFHLLTCMEHYLAVVRPIFYLRLKASAGFRTRNIIIGCVCLFTIVIMILLMHQAFAFTILHGLIIFLTSVAFFFCGISVLFALIRPGPGNGGRTRKRADQSKQRALQSIIMITGTIFVRLMSSMITSIIQSFVRIYGYSYCLIGWSSMWFFLPSSLVLPLLFLQRKGKLHLCAVSVK